MKNSFLLFVLCFFSVLLALLFSGQTGFGNSFLYLPCLLLAYVFYHSSLWLSLGTAAFQIGILSAYTGEAKEWSVFVLLLYGAVFLFRRKVLRPHFLQKVLYVFVCVSLFLVFLQKEIGFASHAYRFWISFFIGLCFDFLFSVFVWWLLEEGGARLEEKYFPSKDSDGQLKLFTVQQLRATQKASAHRLQKRVRRRFGLKEGW